MYGSRAPEDRVLGRHSRSRSYPAPSLLPAGADAVASRCACTRATGMGSACHRRKDVRDADKPSEPRGWHPISTSIIWRTQNGPDGARLSSLPAASHQLHRARAIRSSISANRARSRPFGGLASLGQTDPGHPPGTAASNRRSWSPTPGTRLCHTPANRHGLCCRVPADNRPH